MATTVWSGRLSFGMVAIPVRLFKAARRERVRFRQVYRPPSEPEVEEEEAPSTAGRSRSEVEPEIDVRPAMRGGAAAAREPEPEREAQAEFVEPVRNSHVGESGRAPVDRSDILKAFEVEKDQYVVFEPRELAALKAETSTELEISEFVKLEEIDPVYFDTSYYVSPDKGGEKPYALLFRALTDSGYVALGSLAMHGREHATVIRPGKHGLLLHTLFRATEVRGMEEYRGDAEEVGSKELQLATMLVKALAGKFDPEKFRDTREEKLKELIASRGTTGVRERGEPRKPAAPVIDILEALKKSLEKARKPVIREAAPRRRKSGLKPAAG
jgi:DNA end-binding protein Ku